MLVDPGTDTTMSNVPNETVDRNETADRGVSPVIGIVLLVVISVLLAAVVGAFALELEPQAHQLPQATFDVEVEGSTVTLTHTGGDTIRGDHLSVVVDGTDAGTWQSLGGHSEVLSGDSVQVTATSDETVRIVWRGDRDRSTTLRTVDIS